VIEAMQPNGMKAWVAGDDLETMPGGRIPRNNGINVFE
jgi:hypothetical protein